MKKTLIIIKNEGTKNKTRAVGKVIGFKFSDLSIRSKNNEENKKVFVNKPYFK